MQYFDINECFKQINNYFNGDKPGYLLFVNVDNYDIYQKIHTRLRADQGKVRVYVSDNFQSNGLPDVDAAISKITTHEGAYALIGLSQALMLHSSQALENKLWEILKVSISGYGIVLLDHCEIILKKLVRLDKRTEGRVICVTEGKSSSLPQIRILKSNDIYFGSKPLSNISSLLAVLETFTDADNNQHSEIIVVNDDVSLKSFKDAVYAIKGAPRVYEVLCQKYSDISGVTQENFGTPVQWGWLAKEIEQYKDFPSLISKIYGSPNNLSLQIPKVMGMQDKNIQWLFWLAMKVFGVSDKYLMFVLKRCTSFDSFIEQVYVALADVQFTDAEFQQYYIDRKSLLDKLPDKDLALVKKYCEKLGKYQKNEIYYLTDNTDDEKYEFARCMSTYNYSEDEIFEAIRNIPNIAKYMKPFVFDEINTSLPASDIILLPKLTSYFEMYKKQKLTNRIYPEFLDIVEQYALTRPYNKLHARSSIISHIDKKDAQLFFFDALGVEYLAFIMAKCAEYGMITEVSIGRCELPSITEKNKEFIDMFKDHWYKIDSLDEIKHYSQIYDYQKCQFPVHLFAELDVIDEELKKIRTMLAMGGIKKAVIVSDHGASRLAVLYGQEFAASIGLEESGEHSGRCCPANENPNISKVAYDNGYAVLANYERFKGGRRANVEVHGGASLEEVLVPVITLTNQPTGINICFIDSVITIKGNNPATIAVFTNVPIEAPSLKVSNGIIYKGEFLEDNKHIKFVMPELRRTQNLTADFYDGNKKLASDMEFRVQRATQENPLFKDDKLH